MHSNETINSQSDKSICVVEHLRQKIPFAGRKKKLIIRKAYTSTNVIRLRIF